MPEILWVGPGWYKKLTFAVGNSKVTQVSPNKAANVEFPAVWCESLAQAERYFLPSTEQKKFTREVY